MPEGAEFDVDRSIGEAWEQFQERLADVVSMIDQGSLTIGTLSSSDEPAPYIRYTRDERTAEQVLLEASSNAELGDGFQLSVDQLNQLGAAGLDSPGVDEGWGLANFTQLIPQDESDRAAEVGVHILRDIFGVQHPVFLAPDQLAEVLKTEPTPDPTSVSEFEAEDLEAVLPSSRAHLDALVTEELTQMFGHPPIRDSEGDVAIRVGSTMVFIRSDPSAGEITLFAVLVHDVEGRSRAVEVLNDLNVESSHGRFALHRDRVFVTLTVWTHPFVPAHLHLALRQISQIADGIDDELALKLRGRTTFDV